MMGSRTELLIHTLFGLTLGFGLLSRPAQTSDDSEQMIAELLRLKDNASPKQVEKVAALRTAEALNGLIELYDVAESVFMRRVVMEGIVIYDDVAAVDQIALQKLIDIATESPVLELRNSAVDCIARCSHLGKAFLRMIVESSADDPVRERAMTYHTAEPRPDDMDWYEEIYKPSALVRARKASKKAADEKDKVPHKLPRLRALAFEVLAPKLSDAEIIKALDDKNKDIRRRALEEVDQREIKGALEIAEKIFNHPEEDPSLRLIAVSILARQGGPRFHARLMKNALRKDSSREFANGVAAILSESQDETLQRTLVKGMARGAEFEKIFQIRAGWKIPDPKVDKALVRLAEDKKPSVQREAIAAIARRANRELLPDLQKILDREKEPSVVAAAIDAMSTFDCGDDWPTLLGELAQHSEEDVRNAAIAALGRGQDAQHLEVLEEALQHPHWSTRLAAARAIEDLAVAQGVGALCARMEHEDGRVRAELAGVLWRMTGRPFRTNAVGWKSWWESEGDSFQIISADELRKLENRAEVYRLRDLSSSRFFGIRVLSHRVLFIIDISGSMEEHTRGQYVGETGESRMAAARKELEQCLDSLEVDSLFNIVTFSDSALAWQKRVSERTEVSLEEARAYVRRLQPFGGTNLQEALELAFDDPIVDTIYLLSDGEPTMGLDDATAIREGVASWNKHRGVKIHCIAVGGSLQTLEWLATDSGGQYVRIP